MNCPHCQHERSFVIRTDGMPTTIQRQRQCCVCGWRWHTVEVARDRYRALLAVATKGREWAELVRQIPDDDT